MGEGHLFEGVLILSFSQQEGHLQYFKGLLIHGVGGGGEVIQGFTLHSIDYSFRKLYFEDKKLNTYNLP